MREISTEDMKVGEYIIVDGVEYVAEEHDGDCVSCDLYRCSRCFLIPCRDGIRLKRVEKHPTETQDKDIPMTNQQLAEWLAKGHGHARFRGTRGIFSASTFCEGEKNEAVDERLFIRPWGTDEWIKPTLEIYKRDCK